MTPRNPLSALPPKFSRASLSFSPLVQSVCNSCSSVIASSERADALDTAEELHRCPVNSGAASRVIVVDDDRFLARLISNLLRETGFEVFTFNDALAAAQFALRCAPDVVVTDYDMPDIDGLVLTAWLNVNFPACKTVMVSGESATARKKAPVGLKFALLQKPFSTQALIAEVQSHSQERAGMSGQAHAHR